MIWGQVKWMGSWFSKKGRLWGDLSLLMYEDILGRWWPAVVISTEDCTKGNGSKLWLVGFRLNIKNSFLTARVIKCWTNSWEALQNLLPWESLKANALPSAAIGCSAKLLRRGNNSKSCLFLSSWQHWVSMIRYDISNQADIMYFGFGGKGVLFLFCFVLFGKWCLSGWEFYSHQYTFYGK